MKEIGGSDRDAETGGVSRAEKTRKEVMEEATRDMAVLYDTGEDDTWSGETALWGRQQILLISAVNATNQWNTGLRAVLSFSQQH